MWLKQLLYNCRPNFEGAVIHNFILVQNVHIILVRKGALEKRERHLCLQKKRNRQVGLNIPLFQHDPPNVVSHFYSRV